MGSNHLYKIIMTTVLAVLFAITCFLFRTWFEGVSANAQDLARLKESDIKLWEHLQLKSDLYEERYSNIMKRFDHTDDKLDFLVRKNR